ncbi:Efflux pump membrane transporter BepE [Planctomycetes bacterium MalM25]|nr:Efflux pump membrane transporter BepE [Planctomycetes bacterium MalM25]
MSFAHFFIDRPIFASVLSIVVVIIGTISYFVLPVAQYPEIALPTVVVTANYSGATPETIAETVATPLEQEINGVEGMLYMQSQSTPDGTMKLTITFKLGTDVDQAQVLVQNRVSIALPRLPQEVQQVGVTTKKSSPEILMVVHLTSPDASRDQLYIANYAYLQIRDVLSRLEGVGDLTIFGAAEYSMRVWLDVEKISSLDLTAGDVVNALREQNVQVAAGKIGEPPLENPTDFQLMISAQGRLKTPQEFGDIVVKRGDDGRLTRVRDVARVELGAKDYSVTSYLDGENAIAVLLYQRPGTNSVATSAEIIETMDRLKENFPPGLDYTIAYNPTQFVKQSIDEVFVTLLQSAGLVVLTVFIFLQRWQATLIPVVAIPISLVGTFIVMNALGFSLNNLSLFGLVLAIGIVVDDAIVVVESVERLIANGLRPKEATKQAMTEVGSALIATTLVLVAVFVPTSFMSGISGQFYQQFAITIAAATVFSTFVSLTLTPALCGLLLEPGDAKPGPISRFMNLAFGWFFRPFNAAFDWLSGLYAGSIRRIVRLGFIMLLFYGGMLYATRMSFDIVPTGFIPEQDQGYLLLTAQLPDSASLARTDDVVKQMNEIVMGTPGVSHSVALGGFSGATMVQAPNAATCFATLTDAKERARQGRTVDVLVKELREKFQEIQEAQTVVLMPPSVPGIGSGGGPKMYVQDVGGRGYDALGQATMEMVGEANRQRGPQSGLAGAFSFYRPATPQLYADIDRVRTQQLDVPLSNVFETLQIYLGSLYVNDFNYLGRTYRVTAQAEEKYRNEPDDVLRLRTRSASGAIVPLGTLVQMKQRVGADRIIRYNLYPAAELQAGTFPGASTGQAINSLEQIAGEALPLGFSFEWTDLAYQETHQDEQGGIPTLLIFPLCIVFVFLTLSAQYESWLLPLAVILIVPLCLLFAMTGVFLRGLDNNVLTQIGFVVLIALACKNAILIVEYAKTLEDEGRSRYEAAVEACRLRLRAILMTALSFVLGVLPLLFATGAGSEMRRALGTAVFAGMLGVTTMGLFLTPVFYVLLRWFVARRQAKQEEAA